MYAAAQASADVERTAFRRAEKDYKLYKSQSRKKGEEKETDVSDVFDFCAILEKFKLTGETPPEIYRFHCSRFNRPVFCFRDRPGFYFIPNALTIEEQCYWIRESLTNFPQPSNRTNHTAIYGPIYDLFEAVQKQKILMEAESLITNSEPPVTSHMQSTKYLFAEANISLCKGESHKAVAASILLRKLRWSTLGLQFDWSKRNYDPSLPHNKIPDPLRLLAKKMAVPAMPLGEEFHPEAAIVNYYGASDMLGGHVDDMEVDWSKPIVSISLGCKAVFLLGGKSREDSPLAMFLRSGDIVLMAEEARKCFHGIPRIFTAKKSSDIEALISQLSSKEDCSYMEYIKNSRININIRQVN